MAELSDKATGKHLATIPDNELKDIVFANVISCANTDFDEALEGELSLARADLDRALSDLATDPLLDSLRRPTLEMFRAAIGDRDMLYVRFTKDKL